MESKLLQRMMTLCARKEYCRSEIESKVRTYLASHPEEKMRPSEVISELVKGGFINEERYANAFARDKASLTGWGPLKVRMALKAKGLDAELIDSVISKTYEDDRAQSKLRKLALSKYRSLKGDTNREIKTIRYCMSRGYDYDSARQALDDISSEPESSL